jgi:hypothetical protein
MKTGAPFQRMWRWALLGIALLALLALLLMAQHAPPRQIADTIHSHTVVGRSSPERAGSRVNAVAQRTQAHTPGAPLVDELCGVKGPDLKRAGDETIGQHVMRVTQTVINGWKSALAASDDPRRQAVGLALESAHPDAPGEEPTDTPAKNRLVLLAIETNDPVIYALALSHCGDGGYDIAAGPCQGLSWEHWANIDPDNAVPWLEIAAKAGSSRDQQGVEDALAKASMASRFDTYGSTVSAIALSALPRDIAPLDKAVAGVDVVSALGIAIPAVSIAATLCSDTAVQEPTRRQQCASIANDLADAGTALIDVVVALSLAKRLGFPMDRQAKLQIEQQSASRALITHNPWQYTNEGSGLTLASDFRCDRLLGYGDLIDALQASGGNERAALAAVGRTVQGAK